MADEQLQQKFMQYAQSEQPDQELLKEIEEGLESIPDPDQKEEASRQFADTVKDNGSQNSIIELFKRALQSPAGSAILKVVMQLIQKKFGGGGKHEGEGGGQSDWLQDMLHKLTSGGGGSEGHGGGGDMLDNLKKAFFS